MKEKNICSVCGVVLEEGNINHFAGRIMCNDCLERNTCVCECCGERMWRDDNQGDSDMNLCYGCYERHYTTCEECGRVIHNDNAYYQEESDYAYCHECYQKLEESPIKTYNYKPAPLFYGDGAMFMGVELEIDKGGEEGDCAKTLIDIANSTGEKIYCKHDGSIDDGFEIVSHPMTLDYHTNDMNWSKLFAKAVDMGYRSHQTCTCGLHIHVNRNAFGANTEMQEAVIGRVVFFVEKHWNELVKFSRRSIDTLNRWAARYATISDSTKETYKKAKDKRMGRYVAVNLENYNTVEFRLFRGTLRYKTFIATLQLVHEICSFAIMMSDSEIESMSWSDFVAMIARDKKELIDYLKSKRLYVNEIEEERSEI